MPQASDANNPARVDLPDEIKDMFMAMERRIRDLETQVAELSRQPWQADIAAVRNAIPTTMAWGDVTGKPSTFPAATHGNEAHSSTFITGVAWGDVTGKPSTFPSTWTDVASKPSAFPPEAHGNAAHTSTFITGVAWGDVTSKPSVFPPETHGNAAHSSTFITGVAWGDVTGKPSTFTPTEHGNEAHNPDFLSIVPVHTHDWNDITTSRPSTFPPSSHTHTYWDYHAAGETTATNRTTAANT